MALSENSIDRLTVRHFLAVSSRYRRQFLLALFVPVANLCISVGVPYFIGKILGSLTQPQASIRGYIVGLISISAAGVVINYVSFKNLFALQPKVMTDLQEEALGALLKRGVSFHNSRVSGKLVSDAIDYPNAYLQLCNTMLIDLVSFLIVVVFGIILVALHSWLIGLVLLLMSSMAIGTALSQRWRMASRRKLRKEAGKAVTAHLSDTIVNNATVKTFGNEAYELKRHRSLASVLEKIRAGDWYLLATDGTYRNLALLTFQVLFILVAVHQVRENPALLGTSIFAFSYTITITNRLFQVGSMMRTIEDSLLLASPMTEILQELPEVEDKPHAKDINTTRGAIDFQEVSFRYADASEGQLVFHDFNLHIHPGEKVGLVGASGGGKSTLTRLLLRFEDIESGSIAIDAQNISDVTQTSLRRSIAYVPQEPLLFHRTITENISYGNLSATSSEIQTAAKQAYAEDFIANLPKGYDTVVGERGVKLSGGQRQRIAIARAILKDAPILVLDEATSALDSESENVIQQALNELMENRTSIVIAHRLSTIQRMDRIVVLDEGKIVEEGSHKELVGKKNGTYAKLWARQSGGFIED